MRFGLRFLMYLSLWNYNPYNTDPAGDEWNGENFSWFSRSRALPSSLLYHEQASPSLDNGGRILPSVVRPYPAKTAGIPLKFEYEVNTGTFVFRWCNPGAESNIGTANVEKQTLVHPKIRALETEIFLPSLITHGRIVIVSGLGKADSYIYDEARQTLFIVARNTQPGQVHEVRVNIASAQGYRDRQPLFEVNDFWGDHGNSMGMVLVLVFALLLGVSGLGNVLFRRVEHLF